MAVEKIMGYKKEELKKLKKEFPLESFKHKLKRSIRDFKKAVTKNKTSLIAEIKKASPAEGVVREDFDVEKIAEIYEKGGVAAISILTEKEFFKGDIRFIPIVRNLTSKPLLRKDFIIDEYQIYESRYYGADAVLLIAAILSREEINRFIRLAKSYGMECLVEIHSKEELAKVLDTDAGIIGINNRNLKNLKVDVGTTLDLVKDIPKGKAIVSESGIKSKRDIDYLTGKVDAVLVGTVLMQAEDIGKKIEELGFV